MISMARVLEDHNELVLSVNRNEPVIVQNLGEYLGEYRKKYLHFFYPHVRINNCENKRWSSVTFLY